MRRVIHKWFWAWDFNKEEKWLNEMAAKGLSLIGVGYARYEFEEGAPGEYACRLELLKELPSHPESIQYIRFLEETGVEYLGNILRWAYFRKRTDSGAFDLFSDIDSRIDHLTRVIFLMLPLALVEFSIGMSQMGISMNRMPDFYRAPNFPVACLCLAVSVLLGYGYLKVSLKRKALQKERQLHE